jgi:deoxyribose-phosphate aldolase
MKGNKKMAVVIDGKVIKPEPTKEEVKKLMKEAEKKKTKETK